MAELRKGADYKVDLTPKINAGTVTVTIIGRGGFIGSRSVTCKIKPATLASEDVTYTENLGEY